MGKHYPAALYVLAFILASIVNCGHGNFVSVSSIREDMTATMNSLNRSGLDIRDLNRRRVGRSGYYYVVNSEGVILSHPQSAMAGFRLGENPFIRYILVHKHGCVIQTIEGKHRVILFRTLKDNSTLCLTIPATEVSGSIPDSCEEFR